MCEGVAAAKKSILSGCCTIEASMTGIQDFDEWVVFMAGFGGNHVYIVNTKASKFKSVWTDMPIWFSSVFHMCTHMHTHTPVITPPPDVWLRSFWCGFFLWVGNTHSGLPYSTSFLQAAWLRPWRWRWQCHVKPGECPFARWNSRVCWIGSYPSIEWEPQKQGMQLILTIFHEPNSNPELRIFVRESFSAQESWALARWLVALTEHVASSMVMHDSLCGGSL